MSAARNPLVDRYLKQLEGSLAAAPVPETERAEILREIESHLAEAIVAGAKVHEELEKLGSAEDLARGFGVELMLNPRAPAAPSGPRRVVMAATSIGAAAAVFLLAVIMGAIGLSMAIAGGAAVLGGIVGPFLPSELVDPTLRAGLPQVVVIGLGVVLLVVGALLLRLVTINLRFLLGALRKSIWRSAP